MDISQAYNLLLNKKLPATLVHFLTDRCNARCPFCFIDFQAIHHGKNELTTKEIEEIVRQLPPTLMNVNFTGGEPFLRKDITEIAIAYFSYSSVQSIFITSNGHFTDRTKRFCETVLDKFSAKEIFIALSIDDLPEKHNNTRGVSELFENCMKTFKMLKDLRMNVRPSISITISPENYDRAEMVYNMLLNEYEVDAIQLIMARSEGVFKLQESLRKPMLEAYIRLTKKLKEDYRIGRLKGFDRNSFRGKILNHKNEISRGILARYLQAPHYIHPCRAALLFGVITANGEVFPCEVLSRSMGNLRTYNYDLKKLWASNSAEATRMFILNTNCHCEYECAMSINILSNPKYLPAIITGQGNK